VPRLDLLPLLLLLLHSVLLEQGHDGRGRWLLLLLLHPGLQQLLAVACM
jgi:hypothetical protein